MSSRSVFVSYLQSSCSNSQLQRAMDLTSLRCLINSISRFIHLVTCRVSKAMPVENDYMDLVSLLKNLKPVLDDVADHKAPHDEALSKECEEMDIAVNEAREFLEKWSPRMSKILCVLQSKPFFLKIQISSVKLCHILNRLFESSQAISSISNLQGHQNSKLGKLSQHIEEILKCQNKGEIPSTDHFVTIIDSLNLRSSQELLNESIALEKEKQKEYLDQITQAEALMFHIREYVVKVKNVKAINGIQIPSYFRCPLSLELMLDPVIVASGQTYERATIQQWLDHGLVTCPKTGHKLSHQNLIPNHTVKALIANWRDENKVQLSSDLENAKTSRVDEDDLQLPIERRNSTPRASFEAFESKKVNEASCCSFREESDKCDESSPEHSYVHSRSESASSAISSIDYLPSEATEISRLSSKRENPDKITGPSPSLSGKLYNSSKTMAEMGINGNHNPSRAHSFSATTESNDLTSISHVEKLVLDLKSPSSEQQAAAARELRYLAKYNNENRVIIGQCGAIAPLISLLHSEVELTQEHAVTALLNLSINEKIKARIAEEGALEPLIHVLRSGNPSSKENCAATLFSISLLDEYRVKIGRSGAVKALVNLLGSGTVRGKKDAATALFNLSIFHENKARIVQSGAVKYLVELMDPETEMVDKAVALLANLSTITEGCSAIAREGGIPLLVEIVETGSQRGKENAASILLQLCISSTKYCRSVLQEGAVPPLVALSQSGTPRAKEKAQQLLSHFRSQREGSVARGRS